MAAKKKETLEHTLSKLQGENAILRFVLKVFLKMVKNEKRLPCYCGQEPYNDGDPCPVCFAYILLADFDKHWKNNGYNQKKSVRKKSS